MSTRSEVNERAAQGAATSRRPVGRLAFADGMRGIAALWVVLFHASEGGHVERLKALLPHAFVNVVLDLGHLGVPLFFVLSGFVMALTVDASHVDGPFAARFIGRRLVRLTPPYWFSIAVVVTLLVVKSRALHLPLALPSAADLAAHLVYLQGVLKAAPINDVFWTLGVEVQFYVAFALLMWLADALQRNGVLRHGRLAVGTASAALALAWPAGLANGPVWSGGFLPFWFCFMAGALACWAWREGGMFKPVFWIYTAVLAATWLIDRSSLTAAAIVAAIALVVAALRGAMHRWLDWRALQFIGLVSYSLYLLHNPLTGSGFNVVKRLLPAGWATELVGLAASIAICLLCAWLAFRYVERPSQRWSRRIALDGRSALRPAPHPA